MKPGSASASWIGAAGAALAGLVVARTCVSFQFQSVNVLSTPAAGAAAVDADALGELLALYMAPGLGAAVGAPILARRLGGTATLLAALALMAAGQLALLAAPPLPAMAGARLAAGVGGCIIYVLAVDLAVRASSLGNVTLRMGLVAASWPLGNALALILLTPVAAWRGVALALLVPVAAMAAAALLLVASRRASISRAVAESTEGGARKLPSLAEWRASARLNWTSGTSFSLYNLSFILFTSFAPQLLVGDGLSPASASFLASLPMWLFLVSVPGGGLISAGSARRGRLVVAAGCIGAAICLGMSASAGLREPWIVAAGLLGGIPTAPILARAGRNNPDAPASLTYATLFAFMFATLLVAPPLVGRLILAGLELQGFAGLCAAMLLAALAVDRLGERQADP